MVLMRRSGGILAGLQRMDRTWIREKDRKPSYRFHREDIKFVQQRRAQKSDCVYEEVCKAEGRNETFPFSPIVLALR